MPELGQKHECPKCGAKYYDLGNSDAACPKCGPDDDDKDGKGKGSDDEEE